MSWLLALLATPLVVLDPGHGGERTGTKNADGVYEKTITLGIAQAAQAALQKANVAVALTRADDTHVELDARVAQANRDRATVFVSIHCNSAPVPERRGVETYILSALASDEESLAVMHAEDEDGGPAEVAPMGDLEAILGDLEKSHGHEESARLAKDVQDRLGEASGFKPSRGLRQAPFRVLRGARMAAVLVEVGYLSNPQQGAFLATQKAQKAAGEAIAAGIRAYLAKQPARDAAAVPR